MIENAQIIIPIPKKKTFKGKVTLNGTDVSSHVRKSEWTKQVTGGIGFFTLTLINTGGQYSQTFEKGQVAMFYADNSDATTQQFYGRIDYIKERIEKEGQFLDIEGRHRSWNATERKVCYEGTDMDPAEILKEIITTYLPGYTYTNVQSTTVTTTVTWNYKPFWECVKELCSTVLDDGSVSDCYIDDDLDFYFFPENTVTNDDDAIAPDNFLKNEDMGTDDHLEKTRVTCMGKDDKGIPIIYTAISDNEGDDIREDFIKDTSAKTMEQVKSIAEGRLVELENRPTQGRFTSYLLETIKPGDNIPVILPRQKIYGYYKAIKYTHQFGTEIGLIKTVSSMEKEVTGTSTILQDRVVKETRLQDADNPNKLNYTFNFTFDDESQVDTLSDLIIQDGVLRLAASKVTGYMISTSKSAKQNITKVELRYIGKDLGSSSIRVSCNNGVTDFELTSRTPYDVPSDDQGVSLKVTKINLVLDSTNPDPQVDSLAIFYS